MPLSATKTNESEQILSLKRLLTTLKLQFEKDLQALNLQLQEEFSRNHLLTKELEEIKEEKLNLSLSHEEELNSLKEQLLILRECVKKARQDKVGESTNEDMHQLNDKIFYLTEENKKNFDMITNLQATLNEEKTAYELEIQRLTKKLSSQDVVDQDNRFLSYPSTDQLRQDVELIKETLIKGSQQATTLEKRYADLFEEKMMIEHQLKIIKDEMETLTIANQKLKTEFEESIHSQQSLNLNLKAKEEALAEKITAFNELCNHCEQIEQKISELSSLQTKYSELENENFAMSQEIKNMSVNYLQIENELKQLQIATHEKDNDLVEKVAKNEEIIQERELLLADIDHLHHLLADVEADLKTAQQHLAKKVKEYALLSEKNETQQGDLIETTQIIEENQAQIYSLKNELESSINENKALQEQFQLSLKNSEMHMKKWEEKYFEMYDKWQTSEEQNRELKKLEEKYVHMQHLFSNIENYVAPILSSQPPQEIMVEENLVKKPKHSLDEPLKTEKIFDELSSEKNSTSEDEPPINLLHI